MKLRKHARFLYQPVLPLGKNQRMVTNSKSHWSVSRLVAEEGTVLLKNDGTLPLKRGSRICLFGIGAGLFLLGGGGSGTVFSDTNVTLSDALLEAQKRGEIAYYSPLTEFYINSINRILEEAHLAYPTAEQYNIWRRQFLMPLPELPDELYNKAKNFGDTALFCVSRYSSEGDLNGDRKGTKGDFYLWDEERDLLDRLCRDFKNVVVILNTCGPVSTLEYEENPKVGAVLYPMYGGGMGGEALCRILLGKSFPSGHLQDTLAREITDYPSTKGFHDHEIHPKYIDDPFACYRFAPKSDRVFYSEDIFVGYRWFETFAPEKVVYPFGFGLCYTSFDVQTVSAVKEKFTVKLTVSVKNVGESEGKQVVQVYLLAPQGKLGKAKKVLCAFEKTRVLMPGEKTILKLHFDLRDFASFDDLGKVSRCAFVLEKGAYSVHVGDNVRDTSSCLEFNLDKDVVCRQCHPYMAPRVSMERLLADGSMECLPQTAPVEHKPLGYRPMTEGVFGQFPLVTAYEENRLDEFIASLNDSELTEMLSGHPIMNPSNTNGIGLQPRHERDDVKLIPNVPTADGPMGLRIRDGRGVQPTFFSVKIR